MTDQDPEDLLQQSAEQTRTTTTAGEEPATDRVDAIADALLAIEADEGTENINIRDARLKALFVALEDTDGLQAAAATVATALDREAPQTATQSDLARLLIRAGLQETLPDVLADAETAHEQAVREQGF